MLVIGCMVGAIWCWVASVIALHRAAKARKPGVRYMAAFSSNSALFRDRLYTDEGLIHAERHLNRMAGFLAFTLFCFLLSWLTNYGT